MTRRLYRLGLCLILFSLMPAPAQATSVRFRSLRELVRQSDVTLLGHPVAQESFWQGTRIVTRVRVQVEDVWAGARLKSHFVDVLTPGGVVGEIGQRVDGAAALPPEGQVVLHLREHEGEYYPTGMAQGVWVVQRAPGQAPTLLRRRADRVVFGLRQAEEAEPQTLEALHAAVLEAQRGD